jgi:hypothetical protein
MCGDLVLQLDVALLRTTPAFPAAKGATFAACTARPAE